MTTKNKKQVSEYYLEGIKEGRAWLRKHGLEDAQSHLDNILATSKQFDAKSPIGQILMGERDFWRNLIDNPKEGK